MNRYVKNQVVVSVIAALLAVFVVVASAWAGPPNPQVIQGRFAATGNSQCLIAPAGFKDNLTPGGPPGLWLADTGSFGLVFTFNADGTGTAAGVYHVNELPGPAVPLPPSTGSANLSWSFTYAVADEGNITFTLVPKTYKIQFVGGPNAGQTKYGDKVPRDGVVSADGKIIDVSCGAPVILNDVDEQGKPSGAQLSCSTSLVLIRQ